jgi:hypothetical protein
MIEYVYDGDRLVCWRETKEEFMARLPIEVEGETYVIEYKTACRITHKGTVMKYEMFYGDKKVEDEDFTKAKSRIAQIIRNSLPARPQEDWIPDPNGHIGD